jgi:hypothetical protein
MEATHQAQDAVQVSVPATMQNELNCMLFLQLQVGKI